MNKEISTFIQQNKSLIQNAFNQIESKWNTIREFWYNKQKNEEKINHFIKQHKILMSNSIEAIKYDIINNHPILGKCHSNHAFFQRPLYRFVDLTERQLTEALAKFLNNNSNDCQAFIDSLIGKNISGKFKCDAEIYTSHAQKIEYQKLRIDNIIYWDRHDENGNIEKGLICLEVKFGADLYNNLDVYEEEIKYIAKEKNIKKENISYIVLSENTVCPQKPWRNILWEDVLKKWENIIMENSIKADEDMTRYRSSLWHKILHWEN